jgi:hypothetical protein
MKTILRSGLLAVGLLLCSFYSNAQTVTEHDISDDEYALVPLNFAFPFYGKIFTHSVMYDNGIVGFYDPMAAIGCDPTNTYCIGSTWDPQEAINSYNYFPSPQIMSYYIAPLWTDLVGIEGTRYVTTGTDDSMKYEWIDIAEFYTIYGTESQKENGPNLNTFSLDINKDGTFSSTYDDVNINYSNITVGYWGEVSQEVPLDQQEDVTSIFESMVGEYYDGDLQNWAAATQPSFEAQCQADPLYDSQCPGYSDAYFTQQCNSNPLYDYQCPGYEDAYFNQQCSASPLYDSQCPGYAEAYFSQQCEMNTLYDSQCPGYEEAYAQQQYEEACTADPLYDTGCEGYDSAKALKDLQEELAKLEKEAQEEAFNSVKDDSFSDPYKDDGQDKGYDGQPEDTSYGKMSEPDTGAQIDDGQDTGVDMGMPEEDYTEQPSQQQGPPVQQPNPTTEKDTKDMEVQISVKPEEKPMSEPLNVDELVESVEPDVILPQESVKIEKNDAKEEEVSKKEEELLIEDEDAGPEEKPATKEEKEERKVAKLDAKVLDIVLNVLSDTEKLVSDQNLQENALFTDGMSTEMGLFGESEAVFETSSTSTNNVIASSSENQQEQVETLTTSSTEMNFEDNFTEALSTGQSLGQFLSGVQPDYSNFNIAPPSVEEQTTVARAETAVSSLSTSSLQQNLENQEEMLEEGGGFTGDQRVTLVLMSYVQGYKLYTQASLADQLNWYRVKDVYKNKKPYDSIRASYFLTNESSTRHENLVNLQYKETE